MATSLASIVDMTGSATILLRSTSAEVVPESFASEVSGRCVKGGPCCHNYNSCTFWVWSVLVNVHGYRGVQSLGSGWGLHLRNLTEDLNGDQAWGLVLGLDDEVSSVAFGWMM